MKILSIKKLIYNIFEFINKGFTIMSLGIAYLYCTNLTEKERYENDNRGRKNRVKLLRLFAEVLSSPIFFPGPILPPEGAQQIVIIRKPRDRAE